MRPARPFRRFLPRMSTARWAARSWVLVFAVLLLLPPLPARGAEDAGIRSVFAYGAGNRALALGGAYAGIADDASAPLWNAAGLGWVQRRMLDASYSSLYGLGIEESYAAIVLPSWRYGTVGLTFQQFSVGWIELRDDRNFVVGEDETDSQMQLTLAYGRAIADGIWTFGGAVKLQRHSLAGFSDTGLGADLGLGLRPARLWGERRPWAERLCVGIAVQNAIPPTLRLDQSSVADPATARLGVAYWMPVAGRQLLLLSTDLEKTDNMEIRAHLGVEALVNGMLALRAGYNTDMMTAGMGVKLRDMSIDYVFEDNLIESVHRFGASFRFGRSVEESRLAARQAVEAALEARLAEEFRKRQAEQIASLLRAADGALQNRELDRALELAGTVEVLDPQNAQAQQIEAACWREKALQREAAGEYTQATLAWGELLALQPQDAAAIAGRTRCRDRSDSLAARSAEIRQTFASAVEAFAAEDFVQARIGFSRVLDISPGDSEARDMLERTEQAISRRAASLVQLAENLARGGVVDQPLDLVGQARKLDPRTPGLEELAARLHASRAVSRKVPAEDTQPPGSGPANGASGGPPPADARLSPARRQEAEDLYRRGVAAMQQNRAQDAVKYWELVWELDPSHERVLESLKREYMTQGLERFAAGDLDEAIRWWEKALKVDPTDARAVAYVARAQEQLARTRQILGDKPGGSK